MLIRDLPTKRVLVRRGQKVYWQRYHYRERPTRIPDEASSQTLIPDAEFSQAVEEYIRKGFYPSPDASEIKGILVDGKQMKVQQFESLDLPPRVVIPSAMEDWKYTKWDVMHRGWEWLFPMRLHLTPEYVQQVISYDILTKGAARNNRKLLDLLYTYSSPAEAFQFLKQLGEGLLFMRKPFRWTMAAWNWLRLDYPRLEDYWKDSEQPQYYYPRGARVCRAYIKSDGRLVRRHAREWFPLLVDINARQWAWQIEEAHRLGRTPSDWVAANSDSRVPDSEPVISRAEYILSIPPIDARIRSYLYGDAFEYYKQVYSVLRDRNPDAFDRGEQVYHQFLAALGS